jgi:predicted DNA-binding transcriptional regulator AlpA
VSAKPKPLQRVLADRKHDRRSATDEPTQRAAGRRTNASKNPNSGAAGHRDDQFKFPTIAEVAERLHLATCPVPGRAGCGDAARFNSQIGLLTAREAADLLRLSPSWLAKARMRGDGPPYAKLGRSVRYGEGALLQWMKSRVQLSTKER